MGTPRYQVVLGLMIVYMAVACLLACSLLWNITFTQYPTEEAGVAPDELQVTLCSRQKNEPPDPLMNCTVFENLQPERFVAHGWTKTVHKVKLTDGSIVAVKSVNTQGKDIR